MNHRFLALALGALVLASVASEPESPEDAPPIRLTFGWQHGDRYHADHTSMVSRLPLPDDFGQSGLTSHWNVHVVANAAGGLDFVVSEFQSGISAETPGADLADLALRAQMAPGWQVSEDGSFQRTLDGDELHARILDALASEPETDDGVEAIRPLLESLADRPSLEAQALGHWVDMVERWIDAELEPDAWYETRESGPHPLFTGIEVPIHVQFYVEGRTGCAVIDGPRDCVELIYITEVDAEASAQVMDTMREQLPPDVAADFANVEVVGRRIEVLLITEPERLRPHYLSVQQQTTFLRTDLPLAGEVRLNRTTFAYGNPHE